MRVAGSTLIRSMASSTRSRGDPRLLPIPTYAGRQSNGIANCAPLRRVAGGGVDGRVQQPRQLRAQPDVPEPAPPAPLAATLEYRSTTSPAQDRRHPPA